MQNITIRYTSLFKFLGLLLPMLIISLPLIYGVKSTVVTFLFLLTIGTIIIYLIKSTPLVKHMALAVFWVKYFILLIIYSNNNNIYIFPDSYNYIDILNNIVSMGAYDFNSVVNASRTLHVGFYYIYLLIYQVFGNDFSILLVNTLLITISAILFYKIFEVRFSHKIALATFVLFGLSANMFLFGSFILKDPIVIFLTSLALYLYLNKKRMFLAILVSLFLVSVRIYSGFGIIAGITIDYLIFSKLSKRRKVLTLFFLITIAMIIINLPIAQNYLELSASFVSNTSLFSSLMLIPTALVKFFFAPLPWNLLDSQNIYRFLVFDSIFMMLLSFGLILFMIKWFKFKELRRIYYVFLIPILVHAYALGVEYGGDSTRQRSGIFVFLILTLMIGFFYKKVKKGASAK